MTHLLVIQKGVLDLTFTPLVWLATIKYKAPILPKLKAFVAWLPWQQAKLNLQDSFMREHFWSIEFLYVAISI